MPPLSALLAATRAFRAPKVTAFLRRNKCLHDLFLYPSSQYVGGGSSDSSPPSSSAACFAEISSIYFPLPSPPIARPPSLSWNPDECEFLMVHSSFLPSFRSLARSLVCVSQLEPSLPCPLARPPPKQRPQSVFNLEIPLFLRGHMLVYSAMRRARPSDM